MLWQAAQRVLATAVCLALAVAAARADELTLTSGRKYKGLVVEKTPDYVVFRIHTASGGQLVVRYPMGQVASLDIDGKAPVFEKPPAATAPAIEPPKPQPPTPIPPKPKPQPDANQSAPAGAPVVSRSRAEVDALIDKVGKAPPDWWDSVELKCPDTLDLPGTKPAKGWQPQVNLGAYFWGVVSPNPQRWREGVRLLHHVLTVRKDDKPRLAQAMHQLADCYQEYELDWARSAFWRQKAILTHEDLTVHAVASLARCYWMLGNKDMATGLLRQYRLDRDGYPPNIKLYADMNEIDVALRMSLAMARAQAADGFVIAGDVCRTAGRYKEALDFYQKALTDPQIGKKPRYRDRANANIEAIRLYETLDISRVGDGTHSGSATGFRGPVEVQVTVRAGKITDVKVIRHKEDDFFFHMAIREMPKRIVAKQAVKGIDAVTGATVTSDAIVNATARALADAMK